MEKSQRADFLFEADHEEAPLPGRDAEEDNNASSMLCFGSCGPAMPTRESSRRPPPEAKPRQTTSLASASVTKLGR
jgi:hypothetical protein